MGRSEKNTWNNNNNNDNNNNNNNSSSSSSSSSSNNKKTTNHWHLSIQHLTCNSSLHIQDLSSTPSNHGSSAAPQSCLLPWACRRTASSEPFEENRGGNGHEKQRHILLLEWQPRNPGSTSPVEGKLVSPINFTDGFFFGPSQKVFMWVFSRISEPNQHLFQ